MEAMVFSSENVEVLRLLGGNIHAGTSEDGASLMVTLPDESMADPNQFMPAYHFVRYRGGVQVAVPENTIDIPVDVVDVPADVQE